MGRKCSHHNSYKLTPNFHIIKEDDEYDNDDDDFPVALQAYRALADRAAAARQRS